MAPPYTVCGKCGWWELDTRMGWSCRKCGTGCSKAGVDKSAAAARDPAQWQTAQPKKQQARQPAWTGWGKGWQHSWEEEGPAEPAKPEPHQALISQLLQLLKDNDVDLPAGLVPPPKAAAAEEAPEASQAEVAVEKWNELMRAKHELKKRGDVLGRKQKQHEKVKEALAAAAAAQDEAAAGFAEATGALTKASQEYAKVMPGGGPPEGMDEVNDEELEAKSPEEIHAMLTEEARKAEQAAAAIKKLRVIAERKLAKKSDLLQEVDAEMADAEQLRQLQQADEAKEAESKRKEEQGRDEAAKKRRMDEDVETARAQAAEAAARTAATKEATYEAERAATAAAKAKGKPAAK